MSIRDEILDQYGKLMEDVDLQTAKIYEGSPEIPCKNKCYDCCKQLFPVSFAEAFYISQGFATLPRTLRRSRIQVASKIREKILTKDPLQFERKNVERKAALETHVQFASFLHLIESDCPALDPSNPTGSCTVYPFRNHDCRSMGFSFDSQEQAIVGCFRFNALRHLVPKLMPFNYRYGEKMQLDKTLLKELTSGIFTENILYYTTMCGPLVRNYASTDWINFFEEKGVPKKNESKGYWVVIDI